MGRTTIQPAPTDEDTAAIIAAVEALWPKPVVAADTPQRQRSAWKFSGRWWSQPVPARRNRPWI